MHCSHVQAPNKPFRRCLDVHVIQHANVKQDRIPSTIFSLEFHIYIPSKVVSMFYLLCKAITIPSRWPQTTVARWAAIQIFKQCSSHQYCLAIWDHWLDRFLIQRSIGHSSWSFSPEALRSHTENEAACFSFWVMTRNINERCKTLWWVDLSFYLPKSSSRWQKITRRAWGCSSHLSLHPPSYSRCVGVLDSH